MVSCSNETHFPSPACGRQWRTAPDEGLPSTRRAPSSAFGTSLFAPALRSAQGAQSCASRWLASRTPSPRKREKAIAEGH